MIFSRVHAPRTVSASIPQILPLVRAIRNADVVHIHGLYTFQAVVAAKLSQAMRVPFVLQVHGVLEPYQRQQSRGAKRVFDLLFGKSILRAARAVIFATESERDRALDRVEAQQAIVIPPGAELPPESASPQTPTWWRDDLIGQPLVTYMGRITPKKRLDLLLQAWPEVAERTSAHLLIAGPEDTELGRQLRIRYAGGVWATRVHWLGTVSGSDKTDLLKRSTVFALPSENENFGISVAEALVAGLPVIISRQVAVHDLVSSYGAGRILDRLRADDLADAIVDVLSDSLAMERMSSSARRLARDHYDWHRAVERLESVYNAVRANNVG